MSIRMALVRLRTILLVTALGVPMCAGVTIAETKNWGSVGKWNIRVTDGNCVAVTEYTNTKDRSRDTIFGLVIVSRYINSGIEPFAVFVQNDMTNALVPEREYRSKFLFGHKEPFQGIGVAQRAGTSGKVHISVRVQPAFLDAMRKNSSVEVAIDDKYLGEFPLKNGGDVIEAVATCQHQQPKAQN